MADPLYVICDTIDADLFLLAPEKARQKALVKAAGIRDQLVLSWVFPKTFSFSKSGHAYVVTITSVSVRTVIAKNDGLPRDILSIAGSVTRDGVRLRYNAGGTALFPIEFYDPPCLIGGGGTVIHDGRACTYNLVTLAQSLLSDVVSAS